LAGISTTNAVSEKGDEIYDFGGIKLARPKQGTNIVNGKKIIKN